MVHQVTNLEKCYVFSIFVLEKNDKSDRLILNLKKFNQNVVYRHFEMDNLKIVLHIVKKDCYMAGLDLLNPSYTGSVFN